MSKIIGIDHVQVAVPQGAEDEARKFYGGLLGLNEIPKPANLAARGGAWFECGSLQLHVGAEADFKPAKKAHPALRVESLDYFMHRLQQAGYEFKADEPMEYFDRAFTFDPFGNRIELMQARAGKPA
ncbi:VOC family protein [Undibacterium terreum]|uniref:Glyoxalase n=1 Tax=Undibacterium terreum TaxID=1224302 RepID=A0A916XKN1_9BURK|nr:VOC family protein [Undibacterium terreum]GGC77731.1 glyoxalase [Undibacterium terreum]